MEITLDVRTLLLSLALMNLSLFFVLLIFRSAQKTYPGYIYWVASILCISITFSLLATQDVLPTFLSSVIGNVLAIFVSVFRLEAIKRFAGNNRLSVFNFLLPLFLLPLFYYFSFERPSTFMINFIFTVPTVVLMLQVAWVLHRSHVESPNAASRVLSVFLLVFSFLTSARLLIWAVAPLSEGVLHNATLNVLSNIALMFFAMVFTIGFILLHSQRMHNEVLNLNVQLSQLHQAIEQSPSSIVITDLTGQIEYVNPYFSELTGYSQQETTGMHTKALKSGEMSPAIYDEIWHTIKAGRPWRGELCNKRKDGSLYWEFTVIAPIRDENDQIANYIAFKEDVTERKIAEERLQQSERKLRSLNQELQQRLDEITHLKAELQEQAIRDPLTGLHNRRYLFEFLQREFGLMKRKQREISILLLDLDHFKNINDTYGHGAGDVVLQETARLLQSITRETDLACRYGGEEFLLLLPDMDCATALKRAEFLRKSLQEMSVQYNDLSLNVTASIGLASHPADGKDHPDIIQKADEALYVAKRQGRNRVEIYNFADIGE
ncbi:MAG: diguanylate cyclase [Chloroflexi bacterium]|nr:diguanylate cyclase [Chloroflexota bacterium]